MKAQESTKRRPRHGITSIYREERVPTRTAGTPVQFKAEVISEEAQIKIVRTLCDHTGFPIW